MRQAVTDFWSRTAIQDHLIEVWRKIAHRYANDPTIAGYDILNEPWIYTSINPKLNGSNVNDFYIRIIGSIRTVDPNHIIFLEPANIYSLEFPVKENVVWSPHFYTLSFVARYQQSDASLLEADIATKYQKFVSDLGSPMWIGEFGAFMKDGSSNEWLRDAIGVFNKYQVGWAWWAYNSRTGTVPSPLYTPSPTQAPSTETGMIEVMTRFLEPYTALTIVLGVAFVGTIVLWSLRRRQR